jgi:hypothetical protein
MGFGGLVDGVQDAVDEGGGFGGGEFFGELEGFVDGDFSRGRARVQVEAGRIQLVVR